MKPTAIEKDMKDLQKVTDKYYKAKVADWILNESIFSNYAKNLKDDRTLWEKLTQRLYARIYDFRIWLGEKIAGQKFGEDF